MGLFSKGPSRDDVIAQGVAAQAAEAAGTEEKKEEAISSGNPKLDLELVKIKAQLDSFGEIRKANSERFSRIGEQVGELRGMIMDTNKTISKIEVSATKAIDLVESVQPEKLMIELRKMDGKIESLRANIESNELMMKDLMEELKKMRTQMNFYKGIEQVAKLNEEVKGEILEIKKVEATIERHADKSETIFLDLEKKYSETEKSQRKVDDLDNTFHAIQNDFDKVKLGINAKADKKEFLTLIDKFSEFEKHTSEVLKILDERNKQSKKEIKEAIDTMKKVVAKKQGISLTDLQTKPIEIPPDLPTMKDGATGEESKKTDDEKEEKKGFFDKLKDKVKAESAKEDKKAEEAKADSTKEEKKPEEKKPSDKKTEEPKPTEQAKIDEKKPEDKKPEEPKPTDQTKTSDVKPEEKKTDSVDVQIPPAPKPEEKK